jgi:hypothetical protein
MWVVSRPFEGADWRDRPFIFRSTSAFHQLSVFDCKSLHSWHVICLAKSRVILCPLTEPMKKERMKCLIKKTKPASTHVCDVRKSASIVGAPA